MNMFNKLSLFALLAVSPKLFSQTVVDICGSTAGRSAVHTQILAMMPGCTYAYDGTGAASSASRAIYKGTFNGNTYTIRTYWAGSVDGVQFVALQTPLGQFFDPSVTGSTGGTRINPATPLEPSTGTNSRPEIGFSDVFQTSTIYSSPTLVEEAEVGVIPFKWFKNEGASAGLTNMTPLLARGLYQALGELPLSQFTGAPADSGTTVYATGRNADSGSRVTTLAEIGYGVFNQVNQYTGTVTSGEITALTASGNSGYASGGNVATLLGGTFASGAVVGYLGASDWSSAVTGGAVELSWNGVPYSVQAVQEGQYTFWGYLHQNRMALTGNALSFYNGLRDGLVANPGSVLIKDDANMKVQREGDGAPVFVK